MQDEEWRSAMHEASVRVKPGRRLGKVSPYVYGTAMYATDKGAVWVGEDSPIPNVGGVRAQTIEYLERLSPQVVSFCTGLQDSWKGMVGPREKRPLRLVPEGRAVFEETPMDRSQEFGVDEFLRFCEMIGSEAMLRVGDEDIPDSRHLVEYCNYEGDTPYARMRRANGHPQPYRVKFWQLYAYTVFDPTEHARAFRRFSWIVRCIDPSIQLLCASTGEYAERFFEELRKAANQEMGGASLVDFISSINYLGGFDEEMDRRPQSYYKTVRNAAGLEKQFRDNDELIQRYAKGRQPFGRFQEIDWLGRPASNERMGIGVTEWGISHRFQKGTFRDALVGSTVLDIYNRLSTIVPVATLTWTANMGNGLVLTEGEAAWTTPMYHLYDMYRVHKGNEAVEVEVEGGGELPSGAVRKEEKFTGLAGGGTTVSKAEPSPGLPILSTSATLGPTGNRLHLSITNRHLEDDVEVRIAVEDFGWIASGSLARLNAPDILDCNDKEHPVRIAIKTETIAAGPLPLRMRLPAHSISTLTLELRER